MRLLEARKDVGPSKVAVVLGDLVFENEMAPERVPRELRNHSMVLVQIVLVVREDQIRLDLPLQNLQVVLDTIGLGRKVRVPKRLDRDLERLDPGQERRGALLRLACPLFVGAEDDPTNVNVGVT